MSDELHEMELQVTTMSFLETSICLQKGDFDFEITTDHDFVVWIATLGILELPNAS